MTTTVVVLETSRGNLGFALALGMVLMGISLGMTGIVPRSRQPAGELVGGRQEQAFITGLRSQVADGPSGCGG